MVLQLPHLRTYPPGSCSEPLVRLNSIAISCAHSGHSTLMCSVTVIGAPLVSVHLSFRDICSAKKGKRTSYRNRRRRVAGRRCPSRRSMRPIPRQSKAAESGEQPTLSCSLKSRARSPVGKPVAPSSAIGRSCWHPSGRAVLRRTKAAGKRRARGISESNNLTRSNYPDCRSRYWLLAFGVRVTEAHSGIKLEYGEHRPLGEGIRGTV